MTGKNPSGYLGGPQQRKVIPTTNKDLQSDLGTTVSPHCAPTSLLLQHFIWLARNFLKETHSLTTCLCRHPNYNRAPWCYCNTNKNV